MNTTLSLKQENQILRLQNQKLEESIKLLSEQLEWMKRKLFGKSSEKFVADPADSLYLPGFGPEAAVTQPEEEIEVPAHKKRKAKSTPINYFIKQIVRKYALPQNPDMGIKNAELPDSVTPWCTVDESFLADVIVKKFCDHLPLYRQAEIRTRDELYVSRQTLSSYVLRIGMTLNPLYLRLVEAVKASRNLFVYETPVDVLAPGKGKTDQGYMMVLLGGRS